MNLSSVSRPLTSRTSSANFHRTGARKFTRKQSPASVKARRSSSLPPALLDQQDLPNLDTTQEITGVEEQILNSPSFSSTFPFTEESQDPLTHSLLSLLLDTLLVLNLDVLRNSMLAARKGATEKAKANGSPTSQCGPPRGSGMLNQPPLR